MSKNDAANERVAHSPDSHPDEWEGNKYVGGDGYTMHVDAGGGFDHYFAEKEALAGIQESIFYEPLPKDKLDALVQMRANYKMSLVDEGFNASAIDVKLYRFDEFYCDPDNLNAFLAEKAGLSQKQTVHQAEVDRGEGTSL